MFSDISLTRLEEVHPELARRIKQLDALLPSLSLQVTRGIATWPEQAAIYAQFLTEAGIVGLATAWTGGSVMHLWAHWGNLTAAEILSVLGVVWTAAQVWYRKFFAGTPWMATLAAFPAKKATPPKP